MLKKLANLSVEADGRYATAEELQFLKDYLDSVDTRISAYNKIRAHADEIIKQVETKKQELKEDVFHVGGRDVTKIMKRDIINILRCSAGTMLVDDLDRMREGMLVWFQTIARAFGFTKHAAINYHLYQKVITDFITPEEAELIIPIFQLEETVVGG